MADGVRIDGLRMRKEHVTNPDRRDKISWIVENLGKFAVDSAVNDSGKAFSGGKQQGHKFLPEELMYQGALPASKDQKKLGDLKVVLGELQAEEGLHGDTMKANQTNKVSATTVNISEDPGALKKTPNEGNKGSDLLKTDKKRVFIRSRL